MTKKKWKDSDGQEKTLMVMGIFLIFFWITLSLFIMGYLLSPSSVPNFILAQNNTNLTNQYLNYNSIFPINYNSTNINQYAQLNNNNPLRAALTDLFSVIGVLLFLFIGTMIINFLCFPDDEQTKKYKKEINEYEKKHRGKSKIQKDIFKYEHKLKALKSREKED